MKILKSFFLIAGLCLLVVGVMFSQRISIKVYATDGVGTDSIEIGSDPAATKYIDGGLGEFELPPIPPAGVFAFRTVTHLPFDSLGQGASFNLHFQARQTQTDEFRLAFQSDDPAGSEVTFSWAPGLGSVGGGFWKLFEDDGTTLLCDMTAQTSYTYHTWEADKQYIILKTGDGLGYLTATPESLTYAVDVKGKQFKYNKYKATGSEGEFTVTNSTGTTVNDLHLEFSQAVTLESFGPFTTAASPDGKWKKVDLTGASLDPGQSCEIYAIGNKGKVLELKKWWWTYNGTSVPEKPDNPSMMPVNGFLRLPMPNWWNVALDTYGHPGNVDPEKGIELGSSAVVTQIGGKDVVRHIIHKKYKDMAKTLYDKTLGMHTPGTSQCLLYTDPVKGKYVMKTLKTYPPKKYPKNELVAQLLLMKFNVKTSNAGINETGFGDLLYNPLDGQDEWADGMTVNDIAAAADRYLTCDSATDAVTGQEVLATVKRVNQEFSGKFDTTSWWGGITGVIHLKPAKSLADAERLYRASLTQPAPIGVLGYVEDRPMVFRLNQNYPNPFNPTTNIAFELPKDAIVTLKIYNTLGQEVATLINQEEFFEGENEVGFDASSLSTGVYFYHLVVNDGEFQQVKKMMLLK